MSDRIPHVRLSSYDDLHDYFKNSRDIKDILDGYRGNSMTVAPRAIDVIEGELIRQGVAVANIEHVPAPPAAPPARYYSVKATFDDGDSHPQRLEELLLLCAKWRVTSVRFGIDTDCAGQPVCSVMFDGLPPSIDTLGH